MQGIHKPRRNNHKFSQQARQLITLQLKIFIMYLSIPGFRMVDGDSQSRNQRKISIVSRLGGVDLHVDVAGSTLPLNLFSVVLNSTLPVLGELPTGCPLSIKIQLTVLCLA